MLLVFERSWEGGPYVICDIGVLFSNSSWNISTAVHTRVIQKFPDWVDNEIYAYKNKHSLRGNTNVYGSKTH